MEKKPDLFSTAPIIKHSFATPLTNILLNTEIAVKNLDRTPQHSEVYLQRVLLNAQYLRSMLKLSDSTASQIFSPKNALEELLILNQTSQLKKHLVSRIFLPKLFKIQGNKLSFQEMIVCLLNNAYESYSSAQQKLVFLNATLKQKSLVVSIADGGQGMNWFARKFSVSQLYSTKSNHSGLGLYFVKKTLEEEFSGQFLLRSQLNKGTTITLNFSLKGSQTIAKTSSGLNY